MAADGIGVMLVVGALAAAAVSCHGASWLADRRGVRRVRTELGGLDLDDVATIEQVDEPVDVRRLTLSASLTGIGMWLEISALIGLAVALGSLVASIIVAILVGVRMRAVQEVGHVLVHRNSPPARFAADLLALVPLGRPLAAERFRRHVELHHGVGTLRPADPHVAEVAGWMQVLLAAPRPNSETTSLLTRARHLLASQFSKAQLWSAVRPYVRPPSRRLLDMARPGVLVGPALLIWYVAGSPASGMVLWLLPLLVVYPVLSWASELVEHRWGTDPMATDAWSHHEVGMGQVLTTNPPSWLLVRALQPYGEQFHMLHSVNCSLGPRQLREAHRILRARCPEYRDRSLDLGSALRSFLQLDAHAVLVRIESPVGD